MPHNGAQPGDLSGQPVMGADYSQSPAELHVVAVNSSGQLEIAASSVVIGTVNQGTPGPITAPWPVELSNGTTEVGTNSNPLRVDPTGTTVQPVSITDTSDVTTNTINGTGQISVGSTSTLIIASNTSRAAVLVSNPSSTVSVYIGLTGVTTSTGQWLGPGQSITLPVTSAIYGVVATSTQTVTYLEVI